MYVRVAKNAELLVFFTFFSMHLSLSVEGKSCAQAMREADQEFVRSLMERIEEETCLKFTEEKGV